MKIYKPKASIKSQVQTSLPPNKDSTIMDDPVVLMDDSSALMSGKVVTTSVMRGTLQIIKPSGRLKIRR